MLAQADHNNMGFLSKQHERNKMADSMVHIQRSEKCKFQKISGGACLRVSLELFGASGTRNSGHFRLWRNLQQASHALETLRLESSGTRDLAIPVRRSNQLSYEAADVGSLSYVGS